MIGRMLVAKDISDLCFLTFVQNTLLPQLMMPAETARDTVSALGQIGLLQFKDLCEDKSPLQRTFANQVRSFIMPPLYSCLITSNA